MHTHLAAFALLLGSIGSALLCLNAYKPVLRPTTLASISFISGWLTSELALHHVVVQTGFAVICVAAGGLQNPVGIAGLLIFIASWVGLLRLHRGASRAEKVVEDAFAMALPEATCTPAKPVSLRYIALPFTTKHRDVERTLHLKYDEVNGIPLKLDVFRRRDLKGPAPVLLFIHGGAWVLGYREYQAVPLLTRMALRGWVCFSADYRLSPRATFPEHLHDVKRAIAWVRKNAATYGGDPNFIAIAGNSAGGHLSSLAALTPDRKDLQPGFESVDTTLQACVSYYGVYDFLNREQQWPHAGLQVYLEKYVLKKRPDEAADLYKLASPMDQLRADAPPFFILHGDSDSLVPVREARMFAKALKEVSKQPVVYTEIPGAQHAFDTFRSVRSQYALRATSRFLDAIYARYRQAHPELICETPNFQVSEKTT